MPNVAPSPLYAFVLPGTDLSLPEARGFTFLLGNALLISPEVDLDSPQAVAPLVAAIYQVALASIAPDPIEAEDHIADKLQSSSGLTPVSESTLSNADPAVSNPIRKESALDTVIGTSNPAYFCILVDCSHSMNHRIAKDGPQKKTMVADTLNDLLYLLVAEAVSESGMRNYFYMSVLGYGLGDDGKDVESLLPQDVVSVSELKDTYRRIDLVERSKERTDGSTYSITVRKPIWIDPIASRRGKTVMSAAFGAAGSQLASWMSEHVSAFPPTILNLTDGAWVGPSPVDNVRELQELATTSNSVLTMNCVLANTGKGLAAMQLSYPSTPPSVSDHRIVDLYEMSSLLPDFMVKEANDRGYDVKTGSRGFLLNADAASLIDFLDIGTHSTSVHRR
ncbi:MAG: hypothetical protein V9F04_04720 [Dermatophilaceae bacterium]